MKRILLTAFGLWCLALNSIRAAEAVTTNATLALLSSSFTNRTYLVGTNQQTLVFNWLPGKIMCSRMIDIQLKSRNVTGFINWSHTKSLQRQDVDTVLKAVKNDLKDFLEKKGVREDDIIIPRLALPKE